MFSLGFPYIYFMLEGWTKITSGTNIYQFLPTYLMNKYNAFYMENTTEISNRVLLKITELILTIV